MTTITREQVASAIVEICTTYPDKVNPMGFDLEDEPTCLYDDGLGNHCAGGLVVLNLTGETFGVDEFKGIVYLAHFSPILRDFDTDAVTLLGSVQMAADNCDDEGRPHPQTWGEVLDRLRENGDLG